MKENSPCSSEHKERLTDLSNILENNPLSFEEFFDLHIQFLKLLELVLKQEKQEHREFKIIARNSSGDLILDSEGFPILQDFIPEKVTE